MTNSQLEMAIQDLREMLNGVFNDHEQMKEQLLELRVKAGLEPVSGQEIDTQAHNTCRPVSASES